MKLEKLVEVCNLKGCKNYNDVLTRIYVAFSCGVISTEVAEHFMNYFAKREKLSKGLI